MPNTEDPHSRACGATKHDHGSACHSNCPTCRGSDRLATPVVESKGDSGVTVQLFEGGAKHRIEDMPGYHTHPECLSDSGKPLSHLHGLSQQPPHTHEPVKSWGPAVPL